jgi:hypothetical protein
VAWREQGPDVIRESLGKPSLRVPKSEPIRVLSHSLDFWLPYLDLVAQERIRALGPVEVENAQQQEVIERLRRVVPTDVEVSRPFYGGYTWTGEDEAWQATKDMVEHADRHGRLRAIIDAVRSHRIEDDFSARWSVAREDFERRLYCKRSRIKLTFVELSDTAPVHGPEAEPDESLLWQDFLGLVAPRDRRVVVLLRSGFTRASDIARELGYANHSPVSKALQRIRRKATQYFSDDVQPEQ